jgi:hypothetical protein
MSGICTNVTYLHGIHCLKSRGQSTARIINFRYLCTFSLRRRVFVSLFPWKAQNQFRLHKTLGRLKRIIVFQMELVEPSTEKRFL